jgi:Ni/Fe-hydrogenase subunit HybB-like protein
MKAHDHDQGAPVGGPILTVPFVVLLCIACIGLTVIAIRFLFGLGSVTTLSDGYTWGIWIAWDVVTGTALASGGYAIALFAYAFNRGKYHSLVRPALLTSALGYTLALLGVFIDIGRYWNVWNMARLWDWNGNSILLEVAVCVMAYTMVLWIEISPAFLAKWQESSWPRLRRFSQWVLPKLEKILIFVFALGILLPTMHQSSLGSLLLLAVKKLHPLWHTPLLPLLFLLSTLGMGFAAVVFETTLSSRAFRRPREGELLAAIGRLIAVLMLLYLGIRYVDLGLRGRLGMAFSLDFYSVLFLVETVLFLVPSLMLLPERARVNPGRLFRAAMMLMLAGALYRFDAFLVAYNPGQGWSYFPAVTEMLGTLGLVSLEILAYLAIVKRFPILGARAPVALARA